MTSLLLLTAVILGKNSYNFLFNFFLSIVSAQDVLSQCTGSKICLLYSTGNNEKGSSIAIKSSYYWYDPLVKNCVLLEKDCLKPNHNLTFTSIEKCQNTCKGIKN